MDKEFVPYEQALALKELGFNKLSLRFFFRSGSGEMIGKINDSCESTNPYSDVFRILRHNKIDHSVSESFLISPTFSQAFRWFRDKFDLDKTIDSWKEQPVDSEMWPKAYQYYIDGTAYYPYYKTYEEAELACLIKLIEIIKEKKS